MTQSNNVFLTAQNSGDKRITIIKPLPNPYLVDSLQLMNLKLANDRFSYYDAKVEYNVEVSIIDKATPNDIAKYFSTMKFELVSEDYSDYQKLTSKFAQESDKPWIYNILEGKSEQDRILLDDPVKW